jgi:hypothetical protein
MKKFYCNGKKGYCDICYDKENNCVDCEFFTAEGGKETEVFNTNYERIRNMSVEELAGFMNEWAQDSPPFCCDISAANGLCDYRCFNCAKQWLEMEVTEE